jgi:hypothetical protein
LNEEIFTFFARQLPDVQIPDALLALRQLGLRPTAITEFGNRPIVFRTETFPQVPAAALPVNHPSCSRYDDRDNDDDCNDLPKLHICPP